METKKLNTKNMVEEIQIICSDFYVIVEEDNTNNKTTHIYYLYPQYLGKEKALELFYNNKTSKDTEGKDIINPKGYYCKLQIFGNEATQYRLCFQPNSDIWYTDSITFEEVQQIYAALILLNNQPAILTNKLEEV